jgi:hypothetical protein
MSSIVDRDAKMLKGFSGQHVKIIIVSVNVKLWCQIVNFGTSVRPATGQRFQKFRNEIRGRVASRYNTPEAQTSLTFARFPIQLPQVVGHSHQKKGGDECTYRGTRHTASTVTFSRILPKNTLHKNRHKKQN